MADFTEDGRRILNDIAARYGVSFDAVEHLLMAVIAGHGNQAQFNHYDLGGMGQWSQGGMIMVGDMFNNSLKARVDGLCNELSNLTRNANIFRPAPQTSYQSQSQGNGGVSLFVPGAFSSANWWPDDLGYAASTGAQNDMRYAFFPQARRLAINIGGRVTIYDTRDHQIGGFSQQQSGDQSLSFTSQYGLVNLSSLDVVSPSANTFAPAPEPAYAAPVEPVYNNTAPQPAEQIVQYQYTPDPVVTPTVTLQSASPQPPAQTQSFATAAPAKLSDDDIFAKIEKLAELHGKGILTVEEFQSKKADLLNRL